MRLKYFGELSKLPKYHEANRNTLRKRLWDHGKRIVNGILIGVNFIHAAACSESEKRSTKKSTQIYTEPYKGPLLQDEEGNYYMKKRFILVFKASVSEDEVKELVRSFEGRITGRLPHINAYEIETDQDIDGAIRIIRQSPKIKEATRNYYFFTSDMELDNDKYTRENGPGHGLWWSGSINLTGAYEYLDENQIALKPVTVAVLDSSFDLEAKDLKARYVDSQYHYDFADNDADVSNWDMLLISIIDGVKGYQYRPALHGTQVSCLVACENNGELTNGVAFNASILPLKITSKDPNTEAASGILIRLIGDDFRVSAALLHAYAYREDVNLQIVNMSLTYSGLFEPVATHEAVKSLYNDGVILVAAAGNDSQDSSRSYPASFPEVISVGATKLDGHVERRADFSNFSDDMDALALAAPGANILTVAGSDMWVGDGTSYSAPMAAGAAALLRSIDPDLSNEEILETLRDTAADIETDKGTWKLLNVNTAVREVASKNTSSDAGQTQQVCNGENGVRGEVLAEPVLHLTFNEGSGTVTSDKSGYGNTGTFSETGVSWVSTGKIGGAVSFDGTGSITVSDNPAFNPTDELTLAAWVNQSEDITHLASPSVLRRISEPPITGYSFGLISYFYQKVHPAGSVAPLSPPDPVNPYIYDPGVNIQTDRWYHIAFVRESCRYSLYTNGVAGATRDWEGAISSLPADIVLGFGYPRHSNNFTGQMDDVRVYTTALTPAEIAMLFNNGVGTEDTRPRMR